MPVAATPDMTSSPFAAEDAGGLHADSRALFSVAWPRYASLTLSCWLFVSAFLWPHSRDACGASWIMGGCMAMNAFAGIWASPVRFFNLLLGGMALAWLTAAATDSLTLVNGVVVCSLVMLLALVPSRRPADT